MPVYKVPFTAKGYVEISAPDESSAHEMARDIVDGMSAKTFYQTFADEIEADNVELVEEDVNHHDRYIDMDIG
jgi:hypothetical protein